jgi:hypothetical protein
MQHRARDQHLFSPGPKRILALDGGGIRGLLSLQILRRVEDILRERSGGDPGFRLADYFDLIGGTSTGAIIAAGLAIGMSVDELEALYRELGRDIFKGEILRLGLFRAKYPRKPLEQALDRAFGDMRIGDERIRTGLAVVLKRLDTRSPWVVHNNPRGRHYAERVEGTGLANRDFELRQVVRASTAAPHYFDPEKIAVAKSAQGGPTEGLFVDGGVSPHNNPALQLLMLAWLEGYGFSWPVGERQLLLLSVGTGDSQAVSEPGRLGRTPDVGLAFKSLTALMDDASALNETLLQWLSASPTARPIDREIGDLAGDFLGRSGPLLTYLRYNAWLDPEWIATHTTLELGERQLEALRSMDDPKGMDLLAEVGKAAARRVEGSDLPAEFDLPS